MSIYIAHHRKKMTPLMRFVIDPCLLWAQQPKAVATSTIRLRFDFDSTHFRLLIKGH